MPWWLEGIQTLFLRAVSFALFAPQPQGYARRSVLWSARPRAFGSSYGSLFGIPFGAQVTQNRSRQDAEEDDEAEAGGGKTAAAAISATSLACMLLPWALRPSPTMVKQNGQAEQAPDASV